MKVNNIIFDVSIFGCCCSRRIITFSIFIFVPYFHSLLVIMLSFQRNSSHIWFVYSRKKLPKCLLWEQNNWEKCSQLKVMRKCSIGSKWCPYYTEKNDYQKSLADSPMLSSTASVVQHIEWLCYFSNEILMQPKKMSSNVHIVVQRIASSAWKWVIIVIMHCLRNTQKLLFVNSKKKSKAETMWFSLWKIAILIPKLDGNWKREIKRMTNTARITVICMTWLFCIHQTYTNACCCRQCSIKDFVWLTTIATVTASRQAKWRVRTSKHRHA